MPDATTPQSSLSRRLPDVAACLVLLILLVLFFWRLWSPNPADRLAFPVGDFTDQYFPLRHWVAAVLAEGRIPFWNPFLWGGQPGLADPQAATFYPITWLQALLWGGDLPLAALQAEAVAHVGLAALGTYAFARRALGLNPLPGLTSAITFGFGGYLTGFPLEQLTILETVAWLPWLLLTAHFTVEAATLRQRLRTAATAALVLALALLAGHPQSALYLVYLALAYLLFLALSRDALSWRARVQHSWPALLIAPLAVGIAAVQLLPTRTFIAVSSRQMLDYSFVQGGVEWRGLIEILLPKLVGSNPQYVGLLPLLLVPLALLHRPRRVWLFWLAVAIFSLLLALGGLSVLFDLLYLGLPGVSNVRNQERALVLWSWALALLAGGGLALLLQSAHRAAHRAVLRRYLRALRGFAPVLLLVWLLIWVIYIAGTSNFAREQFNFYYDVFYGFLAQYSRFTLTLLLAGLLLFFWSRRPQPQVQHLLSALLLALLVWDLFTVNRPYHFGPPPAEALSPRTDVVAELQAQMSTAPGRIAVSGQTIPRSNDGMRWRLPLLSGNEPLQLALSANFLSTAPTWAQLQALGAPYIVADNPLAEAAPDAYEPLAAADAPLPTWLVRTRVAMPYAWLVSRGETLPSDVAILERLVAEAPNLHEQALTTEEILLGAGAPIPPGQGIDVRGRGPGGELGISNPTDSPLLLVIAEPAVRGWQITLDGRPVAWKRVNAYNLALPVPPGQHVVTLNYEPPDWRIGLTLSGLSLLATLILFALGARNRAGQASYRKPVVDR